MRLSCNGCRVLRKGCSDTCSIRPCLQWIKSPDAQANATVFLAKFYGRAGLMNLINAGPHNLRPAIFRSLLYEACGRVVNPIYGSVGLLWTGNWQMCQAAVEAVLKGAPIVQISSEVAAANPTPPLKAYDIRHVSKLHKEEEDNPAAATLHKVAKAGRTRFKRASSASSNYKPKPRAAAEEPDREEEVNAGHHDEVEGDDAFQRASSHESSDNHDDDDDDHVDDEVEPHCQLDQEASDAEAGSHVSQAEQSTAPAGPAAENVEEQQQQQLGLELTLGLAPVAAHVTRPAAYQLSGWSADEPAFVGLRFL